MKAKILNASQRRIRVQLAQKYMTLPQADLLEAYLHGQKGVRQVAVHERTCCVVIHHNGTPGMEQVLVDAISRFSYDMPVASVPSSSARELNRTYEEKLVNKVIVKAIFTFMPAPLRIARVVLHAIPFLYRGLRQLWRRRMKVEILDALSVGISMVRQDFKTAGSVIFLLELGELLEEWTHKKSVNDLARCMSLNIDRVWLKTPEGSEVLVPLNQVEAGDKLAVRMGNIIPLDGKVVEGDVMVNQASLTGESVPVAKRPGTVLYAGTVVEEGECIMEVTQSSGQSRYDKIVSMIEQSEQLKSKAENKASNLADTLVPYTLAGSALSLLLTRNVSRALSVLMVDFSCALKLAMPLAVLSSMREASAYHITVKGGKYLEAISQADTIVFDKTGTLTRACPVVVDVIPFGGRKADDMLRVAACLEEHFPHSMANAVVRAAKERGLRHEEMHSQVEYVVAHGISSTVDGRKVVIGSAHFVFEDEKCVIPAGEEQKYEDLPLHYSHLYLAIDGELAAVVCVSDPLRSEAKEVIQQLRELGVTKLVMLTGDSDRTAKAIAAQLDIDEYQAEVLPEDKANFVDAERKAGRTVVMIGDGINDSPALSAANVGVAINGGAAIAREIADITVAGDSLYELVMLRKIAMGLMRRISFNYRFIIGFNGSLIGLGVMGLLQPATSAMLHNLSTLMISLNSMTNLLEEEQI